MKNNGAIPVNIRALYIGSEFICDPSQNPDDDAFIAPGKEKWISFDNYFDKYPIVLNETTINSNWTITTERGTRSSEKGTNIYYGKPGETTVPQFYIGPMMIFFDMFNWRSENGEWQSGWTIPKTADSVTWRILVKNVDERAFSIKSSSFFYLVCNNNIPNNVLEWYISDDADRRYFEPGDYHYLLFNLDKNGKPQGINSFQEWTSCINFLVLTGQFDDGTDIGQTIPFEAVLVTPDPILTLTPNPAEVLPGEGPESQSTIEVTLADANGIPIPNALIHFYTNLGSIEAYSTTDINGVAEVIFVAGSTTGWATITASSQGVTETTSVRIRG